MPGYWSHYIIGPVLLQSDKNPTSLAVYGVEERVPWESADDKCKDLLEEDASLLDPSDQEMFNVSSLRRQDTVDFWPSEHPLVQTVSYCKNFILL